MYYQSSYSNTPYGRMRDRIKEQRGRNYLTLKEQRFVPYKTVLEGKNNDKE